MNSYQTGVHVQHSRVPGRTAEVLWLFLGLSVAAFLTACTFVRGGIGDEFKSDQLAAIQKGTSTRAEVVAALGAPDRVVAANGHDVLHYYRYDIKSSGLFLLLVNFSRTNIRSDDLFVFVNSSGIVDEVVFGKRTAGMEYRIWPFGD
jgi:outer membrane protein assembly factor BamE (lipoprotein component of BamABCDE complex)